MLTQKAGPSPQPNPVLHLSAGLSVPHRSSSPFHLSVFALARLVKASACLTYLQVRCGGGVSRKACLSPRAPYGRVNSCEPLTMPWKCNHPAQSDVCLCVYTQMCIQECKQRSRVHKQQNFHPAVIGRRGRGYFVLFVSIWGKKKKINKKKNTGCVLY